MNPIPTEFQIRGENEVSALNAVVCHEQVDTFFFFFFPMNNLTKERLHGEQIETVRTLSQIQLEYFRKGKSEEETLVVT